MNRYFNESSPKTLYVLAPFLLLSALIVAFEFVRSYLLFRSERRDAIETNGGIENLMTPFSTVSFLVPYLLVFAGIFIGAVVLKAIQNNSVSAIQLAPFVVAIIVWLVSAWAANTFIREQGMASLSVNNLQALLIGTSCLVTIPLAYSDINTIKQGRM